MTAVSPHWTTSNSEGFSHGAVTRSYVAPRTNRGATFFLPSLDRHFLKALYQMDTQYKSKELGKRVVRCARLHPRTQCGPLEPSPGPTQNVAGVKLQAWAWTWAAVASSCTRPTFVSRVTHLRATQINSVRCCAAMLTHSEDTSSDSTPPVEKQQRRSG